MTSAEAHLAVIVVAPQRFVNFETAPVHPIALGPDGRLLAVCNLPDARVELFDVSSGLPTPVGSVSVGLDPVTVRFASSNELWVVNHISSSISIVDLATQTVAATLDTPAGPTDLVFAGNPRRAWVSCSRTNSVFIVNPANRTAMTTIAIDGERPRAMVASSDGSKVYVAIFESGNGTTLLGPKPTQVNTQPWLGPVGDVRGPYGGVAPPPNLGSNFFPAINPAITSAPPRTSLIVRKNGVGRWMDDNNGDWTEWVSGTNAATSGRIEGWDLPDRDVAIIDTGTLETTYARRLMNICMAIAVNPVTGEITVVGTEALNDRRFEPLLNGVFLRVNLALVDPVTQTSRIRDLNPHLDYVTRTLPQAQRALSLGDPRGIEWNSAGTRAYITGMGSRNLVIVDANGHRVNPQPIELGEGPTGLALDEPRARLYVWNRFSSSISVVDTSAGTVLTNVSVFDPTPDIVRKGRRHLYDTRKTSGLGIASCASCHVDARFDRLAWDLGNPAGSLVTNAGFVFHPMKGPMVTQTLQDIITPTNFNGRELQQASLHWRGDRKNIEEFNQTFTNLQSSDVNLTVEEMAEFKGMLASIFFPPNFYRTFDNTMPASLPLPGHLTAPSPSGGPRQPLPPGRPGGVLSTFLPDCRTCHEFHSGRFTQTNDVIASARAGTEGGFKFTQLRSVAEKVGMDGLSTNSRAGFGFMHDGHVDTLTRFLTDGFPASAGSPQQTADLIALLLCFSGSDFVVGFPFPPPSSPSQDVPAATGRQVTFGSTTPPPLLSSMISLATLTGSRVELMLRGRKEGRIRSWLFRPATQDFQSDRHGEIARTLTNVIASAAPGNEFTATLVPEGSGVRLALDRDGDGFFDTSELEMGSNPADPDSHPFRILSVAKSGNDVVFAWESVPGVRYVVESSLNLPPSSVWGALGVPVLATTNTASHTHTPPKGESQRFYRVRVQP